MRRRPNLVPPLLLTAASRGTRTPLPQLRSLLDQSQHRVRKLLLLVPFALAVPAAHAVDWAKCTAMKSVAIRLEYQKQEAVKVAKEYACSDLLVADAPLGKWVACMTGQPTDLQPNPIIWASQIESSYDKKLARVIGEIKSSGCVMD